MLNAYDRMENAEYARVALRKRDGKMEIDSSVCCISMLRIWYVCAFNRERQYINQLCA